MCDISSKLYTGKRTRNNRFWFLSCPGISSSFLLSIFMSLKDGKMGRSKGQEGNCLESGMIGEIWTRHDAPQIISGLAPELMLLIRVVRRDSTCVFITSASWLACQHYSVCVCVCVRIFIPNRREKPKRKWIFLPADWMSQCAANLSEKRFNSWQPSSTVSLIK